MPVSLLSTLCRRTDRFTDPLPREPSESGPCDRVDEGFLAACPGDDGSVEQVLLDGDVLHLVGIELLEATGQFVSMLEDVVK